MKMAYLLLLLLLPVVSFAEAQPAPPILDTFLGTVTLRGVPAPAGTTIDIQLGGSHIGNTSVKADSTYKAYIGVGSIGDSVVFLINGAVVGTAARAGTTQNLDLSLSPYKTISATVSSTNKTIDFRNEYLDINIQTNRDVSNEPLLIELYNNGAGAFSIGDSKYFKGIVINFNNSVVSNATIIIRYSDSDITGIDESSINLYYYNLPNWELVESHLNMNSNSVTAEIPHTSTYALFGTNLPSPPTPPPSEPSQPPGGGGGGGSSPPTENRTNVTTTCTPSWTCTDWSSCLNKTQTRTCTDKNNCGISAGMPETRRDCAKLTLPGQQEEGEGISIPTGLLTSATAQAGIVAAVLASFAAVAWYVKKRYLVKK